MEGLSFGSNVHAYNIIDVEGNPNHEVTTLKLREEEQLDAILVADNKGFEIYSKHQRIQIAAPSLKVTTSTPSDNSPKTTSSQAKQTQSSESKQTSSQ